MRKAAALAISFVLAPSVGCHSAFVDAVVQNRTEKPISLLELDYPSASFGTQTLAPGADFHYRFKVLGHGPAKLLWTNTAEAQHQATGPELNEGDEGAFTVTVQRDGVAWDAHFKNRAVAPSFSPPQALTLQK